MTVSANRTPARAPTKPLLHWSPRSPYVRKAMVALHECGVSGAVEKVRTQADPMIPHDDLMRLNPLSKIPTLEFSDGLVLYGSSVIALWADGEGDGTRLFPEDRAKRLVAERDAALGDGLLDLGLAWLVETRLRPPAQQSEALAAIYRRKLTAAVDHLETYAGALADRPVDIGHIALGVALAYVDFRFPDTAWRSGRPALTAWHGAFSARPSMRATIFRDDARPTNGAASIDAGR